MDTKNIKPIDDLELYELFLAAYPDKFNDNGEDCIWDEVMGFVEEKFGDIDDVCEFMGRVVLLTMPAQSAISGHQSHCLGSVKIVDGKALMTAAVQRTIKP